MNKEDIIKALEKMNLTELNDLVKTIESHFGVVASAAVAVKAGDDDKDEAAEKTEFDVILTEVGQSKVAVIKQVGKILGQGLMAAKKTIETLPATLKTKVKTEEAEEMKSSLVELGATVELK